MLCDLMVQHELIALNTRFRKSKKKLWRFIYPKEKKLSLTTYSVGENGGIASKTVNLTTLFILSTPITE